VENFEDDIESLQFVLCNIFENLPEIEQHALKCKQLFEYLLLLVLKDIWWLKFLSKFKCSSFSTPVIFRHL